MTKDERTNAEIIAEARKVAKLYRGVGHKYGIEKNLELLAERLEQSHAETIRVRDEWHKEIDAREDAEAKLTRRDTLLRHAIQAGRDMHPIYGSTATCKGGVGGQAMTQHCAVLCDNPKHDETKEAWHQVERGFFALDAEKAETTTEWQVFSLVANEWCPTLGEESARGMLREMSEIITDIRCREVTEWHPVSTEGDANV